MAHNIYRDNFYSHRQPAWHRILKTGLSHHEEKTALELADVLDLPAIYEHSVYAQIGEEFMRIPHMKAVYGMTAEDVQGGSNGALFCVVQDDFQVIPHRRFLEAVDQATGRKPVETLGLLGEGETVFLTYKMECFDVQGDEVEPYMLIISPLSGHEAMRGGLTSVRVVCQNTLNFAEQRGLAQQIRLVHRSADDILSQLEDWILELTGRAEAERNLMQIVYTAMAKMQVGDTDMVHLSETLWPKITITPNVSKAHRERLEVTQRQNENHRLQACALFQSSLSHTDATRGTAWGMLNAVTEYVDHANYADGDSDRAAQSAFIGAGARIKGAAFAHVKALING